jgi:hypothetical protein
VIFLLGIIVCNTTNGYTFIRFISRAYVHMALLTIPRCNYELCKGANTVVGFAYFEIHMPKFRV